VKTDSFRRVLPRLSFVLGMAAVASFVVWSCGEHPEAKKRVPRTPVDDGGSDDDFTVKISWTAPIDRDEVHSFKVYASASKSDGQLIEVGTLKAGEGGVDLSAPAVTLSSATYDALRDFSTGTLCIKVTAVGHGGVESDASKAACADHGR